MEIQQFETEALAQLTPTIQEYKITYKPIFATLGEPIDILHCDNAEITCAFKELSGAWSYIQARPGTPNSKREYSVRFGTLAIPNTPVRLFKGTTLISEEKTDKNGKVAFTLTANEPTKDNYQVTLLPYPAPVKNPLQEQFTLTVWLVTCKITNKTDIWWRLAGRTFEIALPRIFWRELPASVIGLTAPYGTQTFVDIVPVFNDKSITLEYGISAWCLEGRTDILTEDGWIDIKSLVEERPNINVWNGVDFSKPLDFQKIPYAGKMVEVEFSNGEILHLTPDHLIMTTQGWIPAKFLRNGMLVNTGAPYEREGTSRSIRDRPSLLGWADRFGWLYNNRKIQTQKEGQTSTLLPPLHPKSWSSLTLPNNYRVPEANGIHNTQTQQERWCNKNKTRNMGRHNNGLNSSKGIVREDPPIPEGKETESRAGAEIYRFETEEKTHDKNCKIQGWESREEEVPALHGRGATNRGTCEVIAVKLIPFHGYVYDITTLYHAFIANNIIVHNCNTPEPYPTPDRCIAYRRNTWWHFEIEAYNKDTRKVVSGDLNIDRHLKITLTTDNMTGEIIRPTGAET